MAVANTYLLLISIHFAGYVGYPAASQVVDAEDYFFVFFCIKDVRDSLAQKGGIKTTKINKHIVISIGYIAV